MRKKYASAKNGKKGGRKSYNNENRTAYIPETSLIILTDNQYCTLIERYGKELFSKALNILENWLKNNPKKICLGKNNYAYFREDGWVINTAIETL